MTNATPPEAGSHHMWTEAHADARRRADLLRTAKVDGSVTVRWEHLAALPITETELYTLGLHLRWRCWAEAVLAGLDVFGPVEVIKTPMHMGDEQPKPCEWYEGVLVEVIAMVRARPSRGRPNPEDVRTAMEFTDPSNDETYTVTSDRLTSATGREARWPTA